ncbi:uncharacterized protein si:ch211-227n13.3 isoform X2 [Labrus bergylta]|uniref:uncharacterized protein si:ch211-227n13.3 isoform X2 n=1 Tax=Labrus bergylta TaxID=56723 RepID=UPI0033139559
MNDFNYWEGVQKPLTDCCYEADGLESVFLKSIVQVDCHRSYQFSLKLTRSMYLRRSSRTPKPSRKIIPRSPSPDEEVIQRRCLSKRQRKTVLKTTKASNSVEKTNTRRDGDILDLLNSTHGSKSDTEENEGQLVEVTDRGVDESDEDGGSVNSSIVSGPSIFFDVSPKKASTSHLCSICQKKYQKAKKMKAPIKDRLLDTDPKSLTCDQWVMIKSWRQRRLPNTRGNLRQCVRAPVKKVMKKNRRKRKRDDSRRPRVAKRQRLHSNNHRRHVGAGRDDIDGRHTTSSVSSTPAPEGSSDEELDTVTDEMIPCSVTLEPIRDAPAAQKAAKKRGGFRDLLAQLRGTSSMIVRETH